MLQRFQGAFRKYKGTSPGYSPDKWYVASNQSAIEPRRFSRQISDVQVPVAGLQSRCSDMCHLLAAYLEVCYVVRLSETCLGIKDTLVKTELDLHKVFGSDRQLDGPALLAVSASSRWRVTACRLSTEALTMTGGLELLALAMGKNLQVLDISHCGVQNLTALRKCASLRSLNVAYCKQLKDFQGLGYCYQMRTVDGTNCTSLVDVSSLRSCPNMASLSLSGCTSLDSNGFPSLPIQVLVLVGSNLQDCEVLVKFAKLETLNLAGSNELVSLIGIGSCPQIKNLNVSQCGRLSSVTGLERLHQLATIDLNTCLQLVDIAALHGLPNLKSVNLNRCHRVASLEPLHRCKSLSSLSVHKCPRLVDSARSLEADGFQGSSSTTSEEPLPKSMAGASLSAAREYLKVAGNKPQPIYPCNIASSQVARRLVHICGHEGFSIGLFWENGQGVATLSGAIVSDPSADVQVLLWSFVAASSVCTFEPLRGSPGRAFAKGSDWMSDVQALDQTAFPRSQAAMIAGLHTSCAVAVHGGVVEFFSRTCLPDSYQEPSISFTRDCF